MLIGDLSHQTGVPARMLRYYEDQGLLSPVRDASGYRSYEDSDVGKVRQIRGLLDSGLPTEIIRRILPFLDDPCQIHLPARCLTAETASLLRGEVTRLDQRIDCLTRNRDALVGYLAAILSAGKADAAKLGAIHNVALGLAGCVAREGSPLW
jgi:DNA-binding transcriptional MerR regulator